MTILIPAPLRPYAAGSECATVEAGTVAEALHALIAMHPELRSHLLTPEGEVLNFVTLYLNDKDIRSISTGPETVVNDQDALSIATGKGVSPPADH